MERRYIFQSRMRERRLHSSVGAKPKGSNGVVAVGLPHRNYSVFKQTHINQWEVKVVKVRRRTHPAQWVGLRALIRGLGVGGRKKTKRRGTSTGGFTSAAQ